MIRPLVIRPIAAAEYNKLLSHCAGCDSCRSVPERECPYARALRRRWSEAGRAARSRRDGR